MKKYIDKTALMKTVHTGMNIIEVMQAIIDEPAADVRPVVRGKWAKVGTIENTWLVSKCSVCGYQTIDAGNFCPNCGADMRGGVNDG